MRAREREIACERVSFSVCIRALKIHTIRFFAHSQATYEFAFSRQMIPICVNVIILTTEENIWKRAFTRALANE